MHTDSSAKTPVQRPSTEELRERSFADLWDDYLLTDEGGRKT